MTVCGIKHADGVCVMGECPYIKMCCPAVWNKSGKVEMTNEEWFCSLSTEEKAEWIAKQKCDGCNDEPYDDKHGTCKYCMAKKTEQIREWLKQPHTVKE